MLSLDFHSSGRHFLQIPGPSPVPDRILRAISLPTIDHRGPEFGALGLNVLAEIKRVFKTRHPVIIYPSSGTGAWEAALSNTLSPGDHILMYETGHFASLWEKMARRLGLSTEFVAWQGSDEHLPHAPSWRRGVDAELIAQRLRQDREHRIKAVCVVHNETSTGVTSNIATVRSAIDAAAHPALLMVDTISGLACADYRHDEWGVDVTIAGSQKGLMLPPGIAFNAISPRALEAAKTAKLPRSFFGWSEIVEANATGYFPYTPNTNLLYGLSEALDMILGEGLDNVFARHALSGADRCDHASRGGCRCRAPRDLRALRPFAGNGPRQAQGKDVPDWASRVQQRPHSPCHPRGLRDGPLPCRGRASRKRGARGDGVLCARSGASGAASRGGREQREERVVEPTFGSLDRTGWGRSDAAAGLEPSSEATVLSRASVVRQRS